MTNLLQRLEVTPISPFDYCRRAIELKKNIEINFLLLAEMLKRIRDEKMYDGIYSSFEEYVSEMEYSESRASKLITVYDFFVSELKIPEEKLLLAGGWSNLYEIFLLADGKENREEFVNETLNALSEPVIGGRQRLIRQMKKGVDPMTCLHPKRYEISICPDCNDRYRIYAQA